MTRYDLLSPRKGKDDKTNWHRVGVAFPRDKGGFQLLFDSLPLPDAEGRVTLMMWEAKPREERQSGGGAPAGAASDMDDDLDSTIPF